MQFFEATDGAHYPVSSIRRIGPGQKVEGGRSVARRIHRVTLKGDIDVDITDIELELIKEQPRLLIPAQDGTKVLHWDDDEKTHFTAAVVGWAITQENLVYPVTADGINDGSMRDNLTVLLPDGSVVEPANRTWPSFDQWRKDKGKDNPA